MPRLPSSVAAAIALLAFAAGPVMAAEKHADDLRLVIPAAAVERLLAEVSPMTGKTPDGIRYRITDPKLRAADGKLLVTMQIELSGGVELLGQEVGITLDGSLDGTIEASVDRRRKRVTGGVRIDRLEIRGLEQLSDTDQLKGFLSERLGKFDYPAIIPPEFVPELGALLQGEIVSLEISPQGIVLRTRVTGRPLPAR